MEFLRFQHEFPTAAERRHWHDGCRTLRIAGLDAERRQVLFVLRDRVDDEPGFVEAVVEELAVDLSAGKAAAAVAADEEFGADLFVLTVGGDRGGDAIGGVAVDRFQRRDQADVNAGEVFYAFA